MARFVYALAFSLFTSAATGQSYEDWWWNADQSGQGVNLGQQGSVLFVSWFSYDENGAGMWLVMSGTLASGAMTGDWYCTTGPALGTPFDPAHVVATKVGTGTLTFSDLHNGQLSWAVNGKSGALALTRQTWSAVTLQGRCRGVSKGAITGCAQQTAFADSENLTLTLGGTADAQTMSWTDTDNHGSVCQFPGAVTASGSLAHHTGTCSCSNGLASGTFDTTMLPKGPALTIFASTSPATIGCSSSSITISLIQQ